MENSIFQLVSKMISVCDGAEAKDGQGFNKPDSMVANYLMGLRAEDALGPDGTWAAWNLLQKYKNTQCPEIKEIPEPPRKTPKDPTVKKPKLFLIKHQATMTIDKNYIEIGFPYDPDLVTGVKGITGRTFSGSSKSWYIPIEEKSLNDLKDWIADLDMEEWQIDPAVTDCIERSAEFRPSPPRLSLEQDELLVFRFKKDSGIIDLVKGIRARFNPGNLSWSLRLSINNFGSVIEVAQKGGFEIASEVFEAIDEFSKRISWNSEAATAEDTDFKVSLKTGELRPFQNAGVEYLTRNKRVLLADDMGLGKTVQTIAALEHNQAYPALIVVPASVKMNWIKEIKKWAPDRTIHATKIPKRRAKALQIVEAPEKADITLIAYNGLKDVQEDLYKAVVFDESHYLKGHKSQRTKHAERIAKNKEFRFLLTGTPIVNRPKELISQLTILDRLNDLGGFGVFASRYCAMERTRFGLNLDGARNLDELNKKLLLSCMVRRSKTEVLKELPAKQRNEVSLEISNRREYDKAKTDLISFLKDKLAKDKEFRKSLKGKSAEETKAAIQERSQSKSEAAARAEQLVKINYLRQLAAEGKIKDGMAWVSEFLATGKKLVVFAHHKEIQKALFQAIPEEANAVQLTGDLNPHQKQDAIDTFQNDPDCQVMVASLKAGGVGVNLQAAADVVFFELAWTPGDLTQAEDRCNRMGQQNAVNAWYLLADDTIDNSMYNLIAEKQKIIDQAIEGLSPEGEKQSSIMKELLAELLA